MQPMIEIWMKYRAGYEISNLGNVRNSKTGKLKKPSESSNGYMIFGLFQKCKRTNILVHRAVAEAFIGAVQNGFEVNHRDGNKLNNCIDNLEIVTRSENCTHAIRIGLSSVPTERARGEDHWTRKHPNLVKRGDENGARMHPESILRGENCPASKLVNGDIIKIREMDFHGKTEREIADYFGVTRRNINSILRGKTWKHV